MTRQIITLRADSSGLARTSLRDTSLWL